MAFGIAILLFLLVTGFVTLFGYRRYVRAGEVYQDLQPEPVVDARPAPNGFYAVAEFVNRIGRRLPPDPRNASRYTKELLAAGYRSPKATTFYYGIKITLAALFCVLAL